MRLRRSELDARLEMTPLIDVVFLLLTFFVFSLVLMVRADVLNIDLPELTAGEQAERRELLTLGVLADGSLALAGEAVELEALVAAVESARSEAPDSRLVIAVDESSPSGALLAAVDRLAGAGMTDFSVIGTPAEAGSGSGANENGPRPEDGGRGQVAD